MRLCCPLGALLQFLEDGITRTIEHDAVRCKNDEAVDEPEQDGLMGNQHQRVRGGDGLPQDSKAALLGHFVHGSGGLIQQPDIRTGEQQARQRNELFLASRNATATFGNLEIKPLGVGGDQSGKTGDSADAQDFFFVDAGEAGQQIVAQRAGKQFDVLRAIC